MKLLLPLICLLLTTPKNAIAAASEPATVPKASSSSVRRITEADRDPEITALQKDRVSLMRAINALRFGIRNPDTGRAWALSEIARFYHLPYQELHVVFKRPYLREEVSDSNNKRREEARRTLPSHIAMLRTIYNAMHEDSYWRPRFRGW